MASATKSRKKPLKGGNSNDPPSVDTWLDEARKIAEPETNGHPAKAPENIPNSIPEPGKNGENDGPKPIAPDIEKVVNRVKESPNHVNDSDWRQQRKDDLREIYNRRDEIVYEMDQLKEEFAAKKSAKKAVDAELLIAVRDLDKPYPPKPVKLYPDPEEKGKKRTKPSKNGTAPAAEDESWRVVPLASLSLPKGILEKLANPTHKHRGAVPPIKTIGDLTDFLKPKDGWEPRLVDIKGMGQGAVDKVDAALEQFWKERKTNADTKPKEEAKADSAGSPATDKPGAEAGVGAKEEKPNASPTQA